MDLRDIKEFLVDTSKYIILTVIVLLVFMYIFSLQQVVGVSMKPTLNDGDLLILNKLHYRFHEVKRNDVLTIRHEDSKYLIKRVIGLPGEKISYKNNILYINNKTYKENIYEEMKTDDFDFSKITSLKEETKNMEKIPDNMYLVLGDNRSNSLDSREIGLISKEDILGKSEFVIMPFSDIKKIK